MHDWYVSSFIFNLIVRRYRNQFLDSHEPPKLSVKQIMKEKTQAQFHSKVF